MKIGKYFLMSLACFFLLSGIAGFGARTETQRQENLVDIDAQILDLEQLKMGYEAKALRHEDQAARLQFDHETWLEARRHMQLTDHNRKLVAEIQIEIDRLKVRRLEILRQNGENKPSLEGGDDCESI
jgi:hypothetical protein